MEALSETSSLGRTARIVVVDDDATNREVAVAQLQKLGYESHAVTNGYEASAMSTERSRCLSEGMNDYLTKPVELGPLADALARWLPVAAARVQPSPRVSPPRKRKVARLMSSPCCHG